MKMMPILESTISGNSIYGVILAPSSPNNHHQPSWRIGSTWLTLDMRMCVWSLNQKSNAPSPSESFCWSLWWTSRIPIINCSHPVKRDQAGPSQATGRVGCRLSRSLLRLRGVPIYIRTTKLWFLGHQNKGLRQQKSNRSKPERYGLGSVGRISSSRKHMDYYIMIILGKLQFVIYKKSTWDKDIWDGYA
jgi:hypothetical protein